MSTQSTLVRNHYRSHGAAAAPLRLGRRFRLLIWSLWFRLQRRVLRPEAGQTTAEYALVLLGVAAIAILLLTWARRTDTITRLFDAVLDSIIGRVE